MSEREDGGEEPRLAERSPRAADLARDDLEDAAVDSGDDDVGPPDDQKLDAMQRLLGFLRDDA